MPGTLVSPPGASGKVRGQGSLFRGPQSSPVPRRPSGPQVGGMDPRLHFLWLFSNWVCSSPPWRTPHTLLMLSSEASGPGVAILGEFAFPTGSQGDADAAGLAATL